MAILAKLGNYKNFGLLLMRAGLGVMMIVHGYPKLQGGPALWTKLGASMGDLGVHFAPAAWGFMAGFSEAVGGLLVVLGLFFRPAAFLILFTLAVATVHHFNKGDGINGAAHAIETGIAFLGLFIIGPGKYSMDKK